MLKEPRPGRVKTRLGRDIGMIGAAWWFRHQVAGLLRRLDDPRWHLVLAVAPDHAGLTSRVWPAHLPRIPQGPGDYFSAAVMTVEPNFGDQSTRLLFLHGVFPGYPIVFIRYRWADCTRPTSAA